MNNFSRSPFQNPGAGAPTQAELLEQGIQNSNDPSQLMNGGLTDPEEDNDLPPAIDSDGILANRLDRTSREGGSRCGGGASPTVVVNCSGDAENDQPTGHVPESCYSGWIVVRLAPGWSAEGATTLDELADTLDLFGLLDLLRIKSSSVMPSSGMTTSASPPMTDTFLPSRPLIRNSCHRLLGHCGIADAFKVRDELAKLAQLVSSPRLAATGLSLLRYWKINCGQYPARIPQLMKDLQALPIVEWVYREVAANDPGIDSRPVFSGDQSYLDNAPVGIGWRWAKEWVKALSADLDLRPPIRCCDIEQRWVTTHSEIANRLTERLDNKKFPYFGDNRYTGESSEVDGNHGTAVSAQLVGSDRVEGMDRIPGANKGVIEYDIASHYDDSSKSNGNVAEAVVNTLLFWWLLSERDPKALRGDVILIEVQRCGLPTEIDPADFSAFSLATALGVVVVEAAGNAGFDLDTYRDEGGRRILRRTDVNFRDSGAIVVGAARSELPHNRARFSNYGSRVDCYGWGDSVVSGGYGDFDPGDGKPESWYTSSFGGTSSASPMIVGVAAWLQCLVRSATGSPLEPRDVRALLADRAIGTPQGPDVAGNIGVMPNLCALLQQAALGLPEIYLRRSIADNGWDCRDTTCSSPDILLSPGPKLLDAKDTVGLQGANHPAPGLSPIKDSMVYFFSRPRNRGLGKACGTAYFYWSEVATLIRQDHWKLVGKVQGLKVGTGGEAANALSLSWTSAPAGYVALLVAIEPIELESDPLSDPSLLCDWSAYQSFLHQASVGCRNTHWIPCSAGKAKTSPFDFLFTGAPDRPRTFDFEVLQSLPGGVSVELIVPEPLEVKLRQSQPWKVDWPPSPTGPFTLPLTPRFAFPNIRLPAGATCKASLRFVGAVKDLRRRHYVAIRQLFQGEEVGRITCYFGGGG